MLQLLPQVEPEGPLPLQYERILYSLLRLFRSLVLFWDLLFFQCCSFHLHNLILHLRTFALSTRYNFLIQNLVTPHGVNIFDNLQPRYGHTLKSTNCTIRDTHHFQPCTRIGGSPRCLSFIRCMYDLRNNLQP